MKRAQLATQEQVYMAKILDCNLCPAYPGIKHWQECELVIYNAVLEQLVPLLSQTTWFMSVFRPTTALAET